MAMSSVVQVLRVRKLKSYRPDGVKWLEKAADKNNDTAQNMLGVIYENGDGVSQGQQQRLTLARTLAVGPEVLLMDEPTSSLDPKSTAAIEKLVQSLKNNHTILWVTHQHDQAQSIADRVLVLEEGQVRPLSPTAPFVRQEKSASFTKVLQNAQGYPE